MIRCLSSGAMAVDVSLFSFVSLVQGTQLLPEVDSIPLCTHVQIDKELSI